MIMADNVRKKDPRCFLHREIVEVLLKNNNDRIAVHEYVLSELGLQKNCLIFFFP
ncbi:hypothetical protein C0J52_17441 [Blattella germanica]|nr:hypothetical protein C0J52_17441 [Blattella germanica]